MGFAIFIAGGKQYKVQQGDTIYTEKVDAKVGEAVVFDQVLMVDEKVGAPFVSGAKVTCTVQKLDRGPKIKIIKFKAKKHHYKRQGHRQPYAKLHVDTITA